MSRTVIKVENLSKAYQIGEISTGTISQDIERWWLTKILRKDDPFLKIGETNDRSKKGESNIVWSLRDLNFEIQKGDAVGVIGKNGAGKSTLLKLLSRVTGPSIGSIKINGRIASLLEVGTGFHPELTGRENIFLNGGILGMRNYEIKQKLDEIIDFSGVERYIDTPVKRYSSGMYVRLAFAVAAHLESEILIVDEVLAVGDMEFQKKCMGKMEEVSKGEGKTVIFVSHNLNAIKSFCNNSILLNKGNIDFFGNTLEAINKYLNSSKNDFFKEFDLSNFENEDIKLKRIKLTNLYNNDLITVSDSFKILIDYTIKRDVIGIGFTLLVMDELNEVVFGSINEYDSFYKKKMTCDDYETVVSIPANLLNNKYYSINILIFDNFFHPIFEINDLLKIIIEDDLMIRKDFLGQYGGVVRPKLLWNSKKIDK